MGGSCPHGMPTAMSCLDCILGDGVGAEETPPVTATSRAFKARFPGTCPLCNLAIHEGQSIVHTNRDHVAHERCIL